jgi:hypothetical protein
MAAPVWTLEALKEHFEKMLSEKDKAVNIALASAKEAVAVAEANAEKWRNNANEWRATMTDREARFMTRGEFEAFKEYVNKTLDKDAGHKEGIRDGWGWVVGIIGLIATVLAILSRL